ncbi:MAG: PilZ domain-containing protein [Burkholderiales bacterium]|nr:PilZ domain-containing protein [Burkholderiales bacterium]
MSSDSRPFVNESTGGADRRQAPRRTLRGPAMVMLPGEPGRMGRLVDVSETGLCVALAASVPHGTTFMVGFEVPGKSGQRLMLRTRGKAMHCVLDSAGEGFKLGVLLIEPGQDVIKALRDFVLA